MAPRKIVLSNGLEMPSVGLGTWQQRDSAVVHDVVSQALNSGYRLIDTASAYRNEAAIGEALKAAFSQPDNDLQRSDVWITSKLSPRQQGFEEATGAVHESLRALQTDYIDLYLVHWPGASGKAPESPEHRIFREASWKALELLYRQGRVRAIGVSNYTIGHLEEMKKYAEIPPMVNQCELHPLCPQPGLLQYCQQNSIAFTAYASLGESALLSSGDSIPELVAVEQRHPELTRAQVLLLWGLYRGAAVIPKASSADRLRENLAVLDHKLSASDMDSLNSIDKAHFTHYCWNPEGVA